MKLFRIIYFDTKLGRRCTKFMQGASYKLASKPFSNIILGQEIDDQGKVIRTEFRQEGGYGGNSTPTSKRS